MTNDPVLPCSVDETLREEIIAALAADPWTKDIKVRVGVLNSIVHLAGRVDSLAKRTAAEEIALARQGVRWVVNRIEAPGAPDPTRTININL